MTNLPRELIVRAPNVAVTVSVQALGRAGE
jgi:hypothetical protein